MGKTHLAVILIAMTAASFLLAARASHELLARSQSMGLPYETDGALEVRLWHNTTLVHPYQMYRLTQNNTELRGELYFWDYVSDRGTRKTKRWLRKNCNEPVRRTGNVLWCRLRLDPQPHWDKMLDNVDVSRLWELPTQAALGDRPCLVEDGEGFDIELIHGSSYKLVSYSNPDGCCPWAECAIAREVLEVIKSGPP